MATSVNAHPGVWLDGVAVAGQDLRLQQASAMLGGASNTGTTGIATRAGVRPGLGSPLLVSASSGMNITVNAGVAFVQGTASATAGIYTACLDATATLTVTTSDPTNPRVDNVIVQIVDNGNATSTTTINIQAGTPAGSPVAPTLPANSFLLATIAVAAGVGSIVAGNITDRRVYTAGLGGIIPVLQSSDQPPASVTPVYRHRLDVTATAGAASPLESSTDGTTWVPVFSGPGAWTTYTPTWTATTTNPVLNNGTIAGRYAKIGRLVTNNVLLVIGSTSTLGTGTWQFSLPFAANSSQASIGNWYCQIASVTYTGIFRANSTSFSMDIGGAAGSTSTIDPTHPAAWTTGTFLYAQITYESTS